MKYLSLLLLLLTGCNNTHFVQAQATATASPIPISQPTVIVTSSPSPIPVSVVQVTGGLEVTVGNSTAFLANGSNSRQDSGKVLSKRLLTSYLRYLK